MSQESARVGARRSVLQGGLLCLLGFLVLTAVVTSQMAGSWLRYVLGRGLPLLSTNPSEGWSLAGEPAAAESPVASLR